MNSYLFNPYNPDIRSSIILLLSKTYPLPAKQVHKEVIKKCSRNISYQYIHKLLSHLCDLNILTCMNKNYSLNVNWLKEVKKFINTVDENYKLDYKIFSRTINSEIIEFLSKEELDDLYKNINGLISQKATSKLSEWYSKYYDLEDKEFECIESIADLENKKILEIGCGTGRITQKLIKRSNSIIAIDNNEECIKFCKEHFKQPAFLHLDIRDLNSLIKQGIKCDLIISGWAGLHYFDDIDLQNILKNFQLLLNKKGKLIIIEGYYNTDYVKILDFMVNSKNIIKEKVSILKEKLINVFGDLTEKTVMTNYTFPTFKELETTFKIEVQFEHRIKWTKEMHDKLEKFLADKDDKLVITESPWFLICENR